MTWGQWCEWHGDLFGMFREDEKRMLAAWAEVFALGGFDADELREASSWLATHGSPPFRDAQRNALIARARDRRAAAYATPQPEDDRGTCVLCGNSGRVSVPSPRALARGRWGTQAVLCRCVAGMWYRNRQQREQQTLEDYERTVPDWKDRLDAHRRYLLESVKASGLSRQMDQAYGEVIKRARRTLLD